MNRTFLVGVDLGQANDYTAIVIAERHVEQEVEETPDDYSKPRHKRKQVHHRVHYTVPHVERFPLGIPYPEQVKRIRERYLELSRLPTHSVELIVDATGVGRPVVDMLREAGLPVHAVIITGGASESHGGGFYRVPKRNLVSAAQVLLQGRAVKIARGLPAAAILIEEMQAFKVTLSLRGHDSYEADWREKEHDDLVLAAMLALWWGEKHQPDDPRAERAAALVADRVPSW